MRRFAAYDHNGGARMYIQALEAAGWTQTTLGRPAELLLIDGDFLTWKYREYIDLYKSMGTKIAIYPHGGNPVLAWDGAYEPHPGIDVVFVAGPGHKQVLELFYPGRVEVVGWGLSPVNPHPLTPSAHRKTSPPNPLSEYREGGLKILVAALHPDGNGYLTPSEIAWNQKLEAEVSKLDTWYKSRVRHIGPMAVNRLEGLPGVVYRAGHGGNMLDDIRWADVVVGAGTYPMIALAMGRRAVMVNFEEGFGWFEEIRPAHHEQIMGLMEYPHVCGLGQAFESAIAAAVVGDYPQGWADKFIGGAFQGERVAAVIEEVVNG